MLHMELYSIETKLEKAYILADFTCPCCEGSPIACSECNNKGYITKKALLGDVMRGILNQDEYVFGEGVSIL